MAAQQISRDSALRIALAARILPDVSVAQLVEVISQRVKGDLTEKSLTKLTVTDIKTGLAEIRGPDSDLPSLSVNEIKEAVRILWGEKVLESLPSAVALTEIPERSVRVAISSNTGERLDGHFGSCLRYLIYQVSGDWYQLIDIRSALDSDLAEDKNEFRAELINDCQIVYVVSVGGPAAAKIVRTGIYPIKVPNGAEALDSIAQLQTVMRNSPPPWLAKYVGDAPEDRIRYDRGALEANV